VNIAAKAFKIVRVSIIRTFASCFPAVLAIATSPALSAQVPTHPPMTAPKSPIDRHALVNRHNVVLTQFDGERPYRQASESRALDFRPHSSSGFQFDVRGLATGDPFPYFPSNGGLLYAVAMMAAGWDGAPQRPTPGFPDNGRWTVRWENLHSAP